MPMSSATIDEKKILQGKRLPERFRGLTGSKDLSKVLIQGNFPVEFFNQLKDCPIKDIFVLEGRPSLKAVKDSTRELNKLGFTPTVMADNMAGYLFYKKLINEVWIACQAVDQEKIVCDIGALILVVLAKKHNVPVYAFKTTPGRKNNEADNDLKKFNGKVVLSTATKAYVPLTETVPVSYLKGIYG